MTRTTIRWIAYLLTLSALVGCNGDAVSPVAGEVQIVVAGARHSQYWCSECPDMFNDGKGINLFAALDWAGAPIPGTEVTVLARTARAGAAYAAEASVRTDSSGAFAYRVPAGAGRTLDFYYRGDEKYKYALGARARRLVHLTVELT